MSDDYSFNQVRPNDLCPCGSGKKFKDCCLQKEKQQYVYNRIKDRLLQQLFDFLHQEKYWRQIEDLYEYFLQLTNHNRELPEYLYFWFAETAIFDYELKTGANLIEIFLAKKQQKLTGKEIEMLVAWKQLRLSVYEVREFSDHQIRLVDLIRNQKFELPKERYDIMPGELVLARVGEVGAHYQIVGSYDLLPGDCQELIQQQVSSLLEQSEFSRTTINQFLRQWSSELIMLVEDLQQSLLDEFPEQLFTGRRIFEASYQLQSRKLASKKLTQKPGIKLYHSEADFDVLLWREEETVIKGEFFIRDDDLLLRAYTEPDLEAGKELITETLKFAALFEEEYVVDEQWEEKTDEETPGGDFKELRTAEEVNFSLYPQEILDGELPQELVKTESGRRKVKEFLWELELVAAFSEDELNYTVEEIKQLREKLKLAPREKPLLTDQVEKLVADQMKEAYSGEIICDVVFIWRDFKKAVEKISGQAASWGAALEYLICRLNYWPSTQKEIGAKYDVSTNTISQKYRQIVDTLDLE